MPRNLRAEFAGEAIAGGALGGIAKVHHLVRQNRARDTVDLGDDFEWIPFDPGGHRATEHQAGLSVVVGRADHQGRP